MRYHLTFGLMWMINSQESGYFGAKALLSCQEFPTAIFAFNKQFAIGALKAARESGLRVPKDLSLVGVDDVIGEVLQPPLTSVRIPTYEAGETATMLIFERIVGNVSNTS